MVLRNNEVKIMKERSYYEEKNIENIKKLRELEKELPPFVTTFFRGIEPHTASRTRIAYAIDLKVFFEFVGIHSARAFYQDREILIGEKLLNSENGYLCDSELEDFYLFKETEV